MLSNKGSVKAQDRNKFGVSKEEEEHKKVTSIPEKTDKFYFYFSKFLDLNDWASDFKKSDHMKPHKSANNLSVPLKNNLNTSIDIDNRFHSWAVDDHPEVENQTQRLSKPKCDDITFSKDASNVFMVQENRHFEIESRDFSFADIVRLS